MAEAEDNPLVNTAMERIAALSREMNQLKSFVNQADSLSGREPRFREADNTEMSAPVSMTASATPRSAKRWQPGAFFGKPFAAAVRQILEARHSAASGPSPASAEEIHEALNQGSFAFDTSGVEAQKHSIRTSIGKNSYLFVKLPNSDLFGLGEWYGTRPKRAAKKNGGNERLEEDTQPEVQDQEAVQKPEDQ
jgi:hypothetical protein